MPSPTKRDPPGAAPGTKARFEPVPGTVVADKYRVERVLGEGGMGVVVAATHLGLDQRVAIKFLLPAALRNKDVVERFQREAKVAAKVNSEHVARVHDVGTLEGGEPFIVMEYLEGSELRKLIREGEPLTISDVCEIALQVCEALAEVHAAGIVHRDLKPSNIFVTRRADGSPCVKVLDFGISKFNFDGDSGADPALTATATIMGSPYYMSPEQLKSTKEVDARTDVWSLGTVLYEAVTGRPPFRGETVLQVCAMIASDDPPLPSSVRAGVPIQLDRAIVDCLEKRPDRRARLIDLALSIVDLAPERARVSLDRMKAVLGEPERRPRSPAPRDGRRDDEPPILPLATSEPKRPLSASTWNDHQRRRRGSGALVFLAILGLGFAVGLHSGSLDLRAVRRQFAGATSAVASAVGSAFPATAPVGAGQAIPSATASATATATASATASPSATTAPGASSPSVGASDETDEQEEELAPLASGAPASTLAHPPAPAHSTGTPPKHHPTKPKHGVKLHRRH